MEINEEKRQKFMENAGKRVNKVMHDIQILEPMARSSVYDFTIGNPNKTTAQTLHATINAVTNGFTDLFFRI